MTQQNPAINLEQLSARLARKADVRTPQARAFVVSLFEAVRQALIANPEGHVALPEIGSFTISPDGSGEVVFVADAEFADAVNAPFAMFDPIEIGDSPQALAIAKGETDNLDAPAKPQEQTSEQPQEQEQPLPPLEVPEIESIEPENIPQPTSQTEQPATEQPILQPVQQPLPQPKAYRFGWFVAGLALGLLIGWLATALYYNTVAYDYDDDTTAEETTELTTDNSDYQADADNVATDDINGDTSSATDDDAVSAPRIERLDTVTTQRYITHMAAQYYGNRVFWVYIYEANKDRLGHPERTLPGTVVRIPDAADIPANPHSTSDLRAARALAAEIYGRFE